MKPAFRFPPEWPSVSRRIGRHLGLLSIFCGLLMLWGLKAADFRADERVVLLARPAVITVMPADVVLGRSDAPISILALVSLTCIHCQAWERDVLPQLSSTLIDTGAVRLVIRPFPLDKDALAAASFVACLPDEERADAQRALMLDPGAWIGSGPGSKNRASHMPLTSQTAACLKAGAMQELILQGALDAHRKWGVSGTPTFVIGRRVIPGAIGMTAMEAAITDAERARNQ